METSDFIVIVSFLKSVNVSHKVPVCLYVVVVDVQILHLQSSIPILTLLEACDLL